VIAYGLGHPMGKSFELDSARLLAGVAAIAVPMVMASPADAAASGGGGTVFLSDESCSVCTGDIFTNTPSSAIVSMINGDPTNPTDQQNTANWGDIYFSFGDGTWQIFSSDDPGDPLNLPSAAINDVLSMLAASVTYEPEDFTVDEFAQIGPFKFETEIISDSDGSGPVGVPEPGSAALLGAGVAALALRRQRRKIAGSAVTAPLQNQGSISIGGQTASKM
jgi:hypothetical protein